MTERSYSCTFSGRRVSYTLRTYPPNGRFYYLDSVDGRTVNYTDPHPDKKSFLSDLAAFIETGKGVWTYPSTRCEFRKVNGKLQQVEVPNV